MNPIGSEKYGDQPGTVQPLEARVQSSNPNVGVIVLNWNGWADTIECVKSVRRMKYPNFRLYVVDNASSDGSEHKLRQFDPALTVLQSGANLGWAGGNNFGIRAALADGCEHVYLLNNDARADEDTLSELVGAATLPGAAALGSMVVSASDSQWVEFGGSTVDPRTHHPRQIYCKVSELVQTSKPAPTVVVKGCAIFLTAAGLERVGFLSEEYFLNYEETDWCYRALERGMQNYFVPTSIVRHKGAVSFGGTQSPLYLYFTTRNRLLFAHRCLDPKGRQFAWRMTLWQFKNVLLLRQGHRRMQLRHRLILAFSVWLGLRDYCMSRMGDCPALVRTMNRRYIADLRK